MCDVDSDYARKTIKKYPNAKVYKDYRVMFELYIDDMLMQTYVYEPGPGKVGFLAHKADVVFRDVQAWNMPP
ncbi:MAG: hypothetical protein ACYSUC_09550 [Planctomycetota bacterium]